MKLKYILIILSATIVTFSFTAIRLSIVRVAYDIREADIRLKEESQRQQQLRLKLNALKNPKRLETLAKTRFLMKKPSPDQTIQVHNPALAPAGPEEASPKKEAHGIGP